MKLLVLLGLTLCVFGGAHGSNRMKFVKYDRDVKKLADMMRHKSMVYEDPSDISVYYSVIDNHTITDMLPRPWIRPGQALRLPFIGEPCSCSGLQCGCCAGIRLPQFNFDNIACGNITYDPFLFALILDGSINNQPLIHYIFSAKNPPAFCIPLMLNGVPTGIDFCIKLYDIYTSGANIHICVDFETRIASAPVLVLHFDCIELGENGLAIVKPDTTPGIAAEEYTEQPEIYDEVTETKVPTVFNTTATYLDLSTNYEMLNMNMAFEESTVAMFTVNSMDEATTARTLINASLNHEASINESATSTQNYLSLNNVTLFNDSNKTNTQSLTENPLTVPENDNFSDTLSLRPSLEAMPATIINTFHDTTTVKNNIFVDQIALPNKIINYFEMNEEDVEYMPVFESLRLTKKRNY